MPLPCVPCRPSRRTIRKRSRRRSPCAFCKGLMCLASRPPAPPRSALGAAWDAPSAQSAPRFDSGSLVSSRAAVFELGGMCGALVETGERACGRAGARLTLQSPCQYTKYCLRAFHCLNAFLLRQNCCAPDSDGFLCDFWFLSRRRADARQGEKDKKHPAHSMQSPAKWVCMEKEEGDCLVQLLPQGGSGTAQASSDVVRRVCSYQLMVHKTKGTQP